uniref:Uncharacterized protein n=1 Tax=Anguilla anguilla TaxID=7936 RepID=A0A0E9Q0Q5_ANGAN
MKTFHISKDNRFYNCHSIAKQNNPCICVHMHSYMRHIHNTTEIVQCSSV